MDMRYLKYLKTLQFKELIQARNLYREQCRNLRASRQDKSEQEIRITFIDCVLKLKDFVLRKCPELKVNYKVFQTDKMKPSNYKRPKS